MAESDESRVRIGVLERALGRQKAVARELEQLVEDKTRELFFAMERIKRQARLVGARTALGLLAEYETLERAAPRMLDAFCAELGWQIAFLWMQDASHAHLVNVIQSHAPGMVDGEFSALTARTEFAIGVGLPGRVWENAKPAWIRDVVVDPNFPRAAAAAAVGIHGGCGFPIVVHGEVHAVIEMFATEPREPDEDLLVTFAALGSQIGQFIERARMLEQLHAKEHEIATKIQTAILPRQLAVDSLAIATMMVPAANIGGDYFDVLPVDGGAWLGIGDVSGHGVSAGTIMLMVQSAVAALVRHAPDATPSELLRSLNGVLHDNIRGRLRGTDHVTLSLLRFTADGRIRVAGAHEDLIIWRARSGRCEQIETPGAWLGLLPSIGEHLHEQELQLAPGDVLLAYTDGLIEARDAHNRQLGIAHVCERLAALAPTEPVDAICKQLVADAQQWATIQDDDISALVCRYTPKRA
jgi:serine phosphatase RsbU (regulator of sigma subunit)